MTSLRDSIILLSGPKRVPKSRSGKLLCAIRDKIVQDVTNHVKQVGTYVPSNHIETVRKLNRRILKRLEREDRKTHIQGSFFGDFEFRIIRPGKKNAKWVRISATDHKVAKKLIRKKYGCKTKFV